MSISSPANTSVRTLTRHAVASAPLGIRWQAANPMESNAAIASSQKTPGLLN